MFCRNLTTATALVLLVATGSWASPRQDIGAQDSQDLESARGERGYSAVRQLKTRPSAQLKMGQQLFSANCSSCHGADGMGDGPASVALDPAPRNLQESSYRRGAGHLALFRTIKYGIDSTAMVGWEGRLSDDEIWQLAYWVRSLQNDRHRSQR